MMTKLKETIRLYANKVRVFFKYWFTDRVKKIEITDQQGKTHKATVEQTQQKVCDHKTLTEIAPTLWKCKGCDDVYFQIGYKVMLTYPELVRYTEDIADHLETKLVDKKQPDEN